MEAVAVANEVEVRSEFAPTVCLDSLGEVARDAKCGAYLCHGQRGTQAFIQHKEGQQLRVPCHSQLLPMCLSSRLTFELCEENRRLTSFFFFEEDGRILWKGPPPHEPLADVQETNRDSYNNINNINNNKNNKNNTNDNNEMHQKNETKNGEEEKGQETAGAPETNGWKEFCLTLKKKLGTQSFELALEQCKAGDAHQRWRFKFANAKSLRGSTRRAQPNPAKTR
eukprot:GHVT01061549.1.p1 GENE.GHVT01061549.1~~GHVT01061549.1.p1  ORF type:complete len:225 (+),score=54.37 GHVT01061549.1:579-1253(+)